MTGTIFALSSGRPPAAIAVIRISGPAAHSAGEALCGTLPEPRRSAVRALRDPVTGELLDEALVLRFDQPHSATGEDLVELHCHGGRAVIDIVLATLGRIPCLRLAEAGEFTRRAFELGRIDLTEAEGLADLLEAETEIQRRSALALVEGGLRQQIDEWRQRLLALSAEAELAIDYVGEDETGRSAELEPRVAELRADIEAWLARPRIEPLRDGVKVVIGGPPNAGKSSLLNALVGHDRAIVSPEAGTTRDHIDVPLAIDGIPVLLTDTAGLRDTGDSVESQGVGRAEALIGNADLLIWLGSPKLRPRHPKCLQVCPKADLGKAMGEGLQVSARTGQGMSKLLEWIAREALTVLPSDGAIALNARQAGALGEAVKGLQLAAMGELVIAAEGLRQARIAFDEVTGRAGVEDFLDSLFSRFCLGK